MNNYSDKDDCTLVQMSLLGDKSAFDELVARHERAVKGTAYHVTGNRFSAEDAAQDAFVSAWMNLSALREREKFGIWVCSIAKNHARTLEAHYRSTIPSISLNEFENFDIPDTFDEDISRYADLHEKIDALSEKLRETIKLHYFSGLSIREIAEKLSISEGTVKWRLSEGRKQLRKGYGVMEKAYNENESVAVRVMRQVEALKLWRIREDKSGFEAEYNAVLKLVNELPDSKEKSHALADTWLLGAWWISGQNNDEVYMKIKKAAEDGHNEDVMESVACYEHNKYNGEEKRSFMLNTQIPYFKEKGFRNALGYTWFWLGYEYRKSGLYEKAIAAYEEVLKILPPENVYYANAGSAIYCETKVLNASRRKGFSRICIDTTGEQYRFIDGKLYLWSQPGYDGGSVDEDFSLASCVFWNLSACDSLMYDPEMKVGDAVASDSGKGELIFVSDSEVCVTPAGTFENCSAFEFRGDYYGLTYCKTFICAGVGVVRQETERHNVRGVVQLSGVHIAGGGGVIPFAPGNRWDYSFDTPDAGVQYDEEIFFEVTAFENNTATVAAAACRETVGFSDTFDGKMAEAAKTYCIIEGGNEKLADVREPLRRANELAVTKRQKVMSAVVENVMLRILDTDPEFNPGYTEKGRWNFYSCKTLKYINGKVKWSDNGHFEWKDAANIEPEGGKMLYSFFDHIVAKCGMGLWSDEWVPGFTSKPEKPLKQFAVSEDETVVTPAGTFKNCRHICFDLDLNYYFGGKSDCWYAEGIGFVKFIHGIDDNTTAVWQLTEYRGVGEGYFPVSDGLYRKYEPDAIGNGYRASLEYTFVSDENGTCVFRNATGVQSRRNYEAAPAD